jgi:hypothetical protein
VPVYATRKFRNIAAALMLLSGFTHVGQLWMVKLDAQALLSASLGMFYLLIGLGLSGQSRFTLWLASALPAAGAVLGLTMLAENIKQPMLLWHVAVDFLVVALCLYILYRTRHANMD